MSRTRYKDPLVKSHFIDRNFYLGISIVLTVLVFWGFSHTYLKPEAGPEIVAAHWLNQAKDITVATWMLLFLLQASLIRFGKREAHKILGYSSLAFSLAIVAASISLLYYNLSFGLTDESVENTKHVVPIQIMDTILFVVFYSTAVGLRENAKWHKSLMVAALISLVPYGLSRLPVDWENTFSFIGAPVSLLIHLVADLVMVAFYSLRLRAGFRVPKEGFICVSVLILVHNFVISFTFLDIWTRAAEAILG